MSPPPIQVALARKYGRQYGVDPKLLLAIGGHETQWGSAGAGRPSQGGYVLGYGVTDSGTLGQYHGIDNQYHFAASTLSKWGVHSLADVLGGKASRYATDPGWERGVASVYQGLGGMPSSPIPSATPAPMPTQPLAGAQNPNTTPQRGIPFQVPQQVLASVNASLAAPSAFSSSQVSLPTFIGRTLAPPPPPSRVKATHQPGPNVPATPGAAGLVSIAARQLGQPYVWGGESRKEGGFDCSGLVDWAMRQQGYQGPRLTTYNIAGLGQSVKGQPLQPGDLVLANHGEHVVIYAGHGKVIAAPHRGTTVQWQPLSKFDITDVRRV